MNKYSCVMASAVIAALLCLMSGCQKSPDQEAVVSKNDGAYEAAIEISAEQQEGQELVSEAEVMSFKDNFTSSDGSITYTIDLKAPKNTSLPVIRVTPHTFTIEEAQHIAKVLFGDADIYEYSLEKGKGEIESEILSLQKHISDRTALLEYYGGDEATADQVEENYKQRIATLEELYLNASDIIDEQLCQWKFYPQSHYIDPSWGIDTSDGDDDTKELKASVMLDGLPYKYSVYNREASDYRIHNIYAYLDDDVLPEAELYSSQKPTEEDVDNARAEAERILEEMAMGSWSIDSCEVAEVIGRETGKTMYSINIVATPTYKEIKVTHHSQLSNLKNEDSYASNYYYEEITFWFGNDHLILFDYRSPMDIVNVVNENVEIKSFEEIIERIKNQLRLLDGAYFWGVEDMSITINHIELGLSRIRVRNNESDFYLTPSYTIYGLIPVSGYDANGKPFETELETELLVINAVDGSIINTELGY